MDKNQDLEETSRLFCLFDCNWLKNCNSDDKFYLLKLNLLKIQNKVQTFEAYH